MNIIIIIIINLFNFIVFLSLFLYSLIIYLITTIARKIRLINKRLKNFFIYNKIIKFPFSALNIPYIKISVIINIIKRLINNYNLLTLIYILFIIYILFLKSIYIN